MNMSDCMLNGDIHPAFSVHVQLPPSCCFTCITVNVNDLLFIKPF